MRQRIKHHLFIVMFFIIIVLLQEPVAIGKNVGTLELINESKIEYTQNGSLKDIGIAKLFFKDIHGDTRPTNERYIILFLQKDYPIIGAKISGHTIKLKIEDVDGDGKLELLVFYFAGGNQYVLKLYEILEDHLIPFKTQPVSSNMENIEINNGKITVKNSLIDKNGKRYEIIDSYKINDAECALIRGETGTFFK